MKKLLILLLALLGLGCARSHLYPGDKTEIRECRWCGGTGVESGEAYEGPPPPGVKPGGPCVGCRGAKKLTVIIPGPEHPAWVKGTVRDASKVQNLPVETVLMENQRPMQPVVGAVTGAKLRFEGNGTAVEILSNNTGRFKVMLKPGNYKVKVQATGFPEITQDVSVAARREPIWQERAKLVTPEQAADETLVDILVNP